LGVVGDDFSFVIRRVPIVLFNKRQLGRGPARDAVVGYGDVNGIRGLAFRHVAFNAGPVGGVRFVATRAYTIRVRNRGSMRIVAGGAGETSLRFQETCGLPKPVSFTDQFQFLVMTCARRMIEVLNVVA